MSELVKEERVTTVTYIECPICKEDLELKLAVKILINQAIPDDGSSQVFVGLLSRESYSVHTCWPKEVKP